MLKQYTSMQVVHDLVGVPRVDLAVKGTNPGWTFGPAVVTSGSRLLNCRRCWRLPRLVRYAHMKAVQDLLGLHVLGVYTLLWV